MLPLRDNPQVAQLQSMGMIMLVGQYQHYYLYLLNIMIENKILVPITLGTAAAAIAYMLYKSSSFRQPEAKVIAAEEISQVQPIKNIFQWNTKTSNAGSFSIQGTKVTRVDADAMLKQIVSLYPLSQKSTKTFRVNKYQDHSPVIFGILTASRKNQQYSGNHVKSVGFWTNPLNQKGQIVIDKSTQDTGYQLYVEEGETIAMEVDLPALNISFVKKQNNKKWIFPLAEHYQKQSTYVFMSFYGKGSCMEVIEN